MNSVSSNDSHNYSYDEDSDTETKAATLATDKESYDMVRKSLT